ncbi:MAG: cytochrome-c peroxidase, partial [Gemmatimonadaceae bacterium]
APSTVTSAVTAFYASKFERQPDAATLTALGRALFFDATLSASGRMACATCHDPAYAWGPPNARAVQLGGADLRTPGVRAVPSLRYQQDTPPFSEHFTDDDDDDGMDQGPAGGRDWDGRASSAHEQARTPLLSQFEMANADSTAVVARLRASPNAAPFRRAFGDQVFDTPTLAWNGLLMAFEVFQQSPADFYPYTSKYDAYLRGKVPLSAQEARGLALFNDPAKGNCAQCHPSGMQRGAAPQFTDRGFVALGVPRNRAIPANADPGYFDLGLCGPLRSDLNAHTEYCGMFKTPTLRNVALRAAFFHNGVFKSLEEVVRFYQQRDVRPGTFYPHGAKFDDLPRAHRANVTFDPPFSNGTPAAPRFTNAEAADIVAFLRTLTDGDTHAAPRE